MKNRIFIFLITLILTFSLSLCVSAELREPARENMEKVLELGYDLDSMPTKIVRFEKGLPIFFDETKDDITNGDWELWYIDDTDGLENFKNNPANAKFIASQEAMYGEKGIMESYWMHPDMPGIYIAKLVVACGIVDKPYTYIDAHKKNANANYEYTAVTFCGDCDLNMKMDMKDVLLLRMKLGRLMGSAYEKQYDVNNDKSVDMRDLLLLRQRIAHSKTVTLYEFEFDVLKK